MVRQVSSVLTRPPPLNGLNAFDGIGSMPEGFALVLRNLFAQPYGCQVRKGYVQHASGLDGAVETICSHNTSISKLYAFSDNGTTSTMYDVTNANATPVEEVTDLSNARWQHINFPNAAGVHLIAVNGEDDMIWIEPDNTVNSIVKGDGTGNTISGVDPRLFIHVYSHQKRLWFVEKDSTRGWYLPPDQIFGTATSFDFGPLLTRGGYITQIITWTIDDGSGADDNLAVISSEGEVAVYQGIDPSSAETWGLKGVYFAGAPLGRRAAVRYGGDILILTQFGIVMLSDLLRGVKVNPNDADSGKYVQQLVSNAATQYGESFGWQAFIYPGANMVMVNVPTFTSPFQFVMNDITKAWSEFIGYSANCWELHKNSPLYGADGIVCRAWEQNTDNATVVGGIVTNGDEIRAEAQTTFSFFNEGSLQKHFKLVRPMILSNGKFNLSLATNVDFSFGAPISPVSVNSYVPGQWDNALWGNARWSGGLKTHRQWYQAEGIGVTASLTLMIRSVSETYWASTDWLYEKGGVF